MTKDYNKAIAELKKRKEALNNSKQVKCTYKECIDFDCHGLKNSDDCCIKCTKFENPLTSCGVNCSHLKNWLTCEHVKKEVL